MTDRTRWLLLAASFAFSTALCLYAYARIAEHSRWVFLPAALYAAGWAAVCVRRAKP